MQAFANLDVADYTFTPVASISVTQKWSRLSEQYISVLKWEAVTGYAASVEDSELK